MRIYFLNITGCAADQTESLQAMAQMVAQDLLNNRITKIKFVTPVDQASQETAATFGEYVGISGTFEMTSCTDSGLDQGELSNVLSGVLDKSDPEYTTVACMDGTNMAGCIRALTGITCDLKPANVVLVEITALRKFDSDPVQIHGPNCICVACR